MRGKTKRPTTRTNNPATAISDQKVASRLLRSTCLLRSTGTTCDTSAQQWQHSSLRVRTPAKSGPPTDALLDANFAQRSEPDFSDLPRGRGVDPSQPSPV